ncbi:MAG: DUF2842 domain-containing protein [Rhizobiaceae bacterium]
MNPRLKTFIGSILLVAMMAIYALVAITVASARLAESSGLVHLAFFAITGLLWILPAMGLVSWMLRDRRGKSKP